MRRRRRAELARYAAPVAFLVAVTVAVLLVRSAVDDDKPASQPTTTAERPQPGRPNPPRPPPPAAQPTPPPPSTQAAIYHEVESGDTFGTISARFGTSVEELERLNPGVESSALSIGQRIRVK